MAPWDSGDWGKAPDWDAMPHSGRRPSRSARARGRARTWLRSMASRLATREIGSGSRTEVASTASRAGGVAQATALAGTESLDASPRPRPALLYLAWCCSRSPSCSRSPGPPVRGRRQAGVRRSESAAVTSITRSCLPAVPWLRRAADLDDRAAGDQFQEPRRPVPPRPVPSRAAAPRRSARPGPRLPPPAVARRHQARPQAAASRPRKRRRWSRSR